ncbi:MULTISPECIES: tetratricopeptide repeat protein [unclassified Lentimicrobium]|uniref:tetratricopeptide repeat protein n=1 Tax=unclassified Lentimicrobium TaxID=2677434 RepID=UPI001556561B|nr:MULTISPECIES: tetratricopeptide repeat protein [unclassified Lentimicrobium]NPD45545.1 tetratricopeptide repeat protein [Lentimicrobium sp. S6]NPD83624.1 tetratricopeptide repeat protein [Lentimicrobium sp. L6]
MSKRKKRASNIDFFKKHITPLMISIIAVLGFLIYSNTYHATFHFDDFFFIKNNDTIKKLSTFLSLDYWSNIYQRPLSSFTFAINYWLHDFSLFGYHFVNIVMHILTSISVYFLSILLLQNTKQFSNQNQSISRAIALFTALLFLSHPIQTQSVNYIVQRMTLMAGLFFILACISYFKARIHYFHGGIKKSWPYYLLTLILFYASSFSKQNGFVLPLLLLLMEIVFIRKPNGEMAKKTIYSLSALYTIIGLVVLTIDILPQETNDITRFEYLATQTKVVFNYIYLLILPINQNFDPYIIVSNSFLGTYELIATIGHLGIMTLGILVFKKNKLITFGIFWFYITLLVESSIIPIRDVMFEHRLYLPSFGYYFIFTTLLFPLSLQKTSKTNTILIFSTIILIFSMMSYNRNKVWQNEFSLWYDVTTNPPVKSRPYRYLGVEYIRMQKYNEALNALDEALKRDPSRWQEHNNKSTIYQIKKNYPAAIKELNICIDIEPNKEEFYIDRASLYLKINKSDECKSDLQRAVSINPKNVKAHFNLAVYYLNKEKYRKAFKHLSKVIALDPNHIDAYNNRGIAMLNLEKNTKAISDFSKVIELDPSRVSAYKNRAKAYFILEQYGKASKDYSSLIFIDRKDGNAYMNRATCYIKLKDFKSAFLDLQNAKKHGQQISTKLYNEVEAYSKQQK